MKKIHQWEKSVRTDTEQNLNDYCWKPVTSFRLFLPQTWMKRWTPIAPNIHRAESVGSFSSRQKSLGKCFSLVEH